MEAFTEGAEFQGLCDQCLHWSQRLLGFVFGTTRRNFCRTCRGWIRTADNTRKIKAQLAEVET